MKRPGTARGIRTTQSRAADKVPRDERVIDFERYLPTVLSSLVAKFRANANAFFPPAYGVSITEWRILSFLREYGPASAYDIWTKAHLDKAMVSRETGSLSKKGLIRIAPVKDSARNRSEISLSPAGIALLDHSFDEVLRRHDNLTDGLDAKSIETFFHVLRHLERRMGHMGDPSEATDSPHAPIKRIAPKGSED
jgi:DNA-binding MarR family transcriptional regulator